MISVIIPVYNGEIYIEDIFRCFQSQSYKNFELIFINDGSTDDSLYQIKKYARNVDFDVKIINQNNQGVCVARNRGIEESIGDYICFCDVDDLIHDDFLLLLHKNIIKERDCDVAICGTKVIKSNDEYFNSKNVSYKSTTLYYNSSDALIMYLYGVFKTGVWGAIYKSELVKDNKLLFEVGYKYSEDLHYMWRILGLSKKIALMSEPLYYYKWNAGSAMSKFNKSRFDGYILMQKLNLFWNSVNPSFGVLFKKYAPARIMWSVMRQASCKMPYKDFKLFFVDYDLRKEMKKLLSFRERKVALSAFIYLLCPFLFYQVARNIGKEKVH